MPDQEPDHFVDLAAPAEGDKWPRTIVTRCGKKFREDGPVQDIVPLWPARDMLTAQIRQRVAMVTCAECRKHDTYLKIAAALGTIATPAPA